MNYLDIPVLREKIALLPDKPGSYQMKDARGTIIYVGKAKSLVKRVKQYFTRPQVGKVARMVAEIADFDIIETSSEKESLLLEINLIQKYYPKYNILLKDGKKFIPFAHGAEKYAVIAGESLRIIQCFQVRLFVLPQHAQEAAEQPHIPEKLRMRH